MPALTKPSKSAKSRPVTMSLTHDGHLRFLLRNCCRTWCYNGRMTERISQRELRNDSGRIMRGLDDGHSYIVTRRHEPVGELRPMRRRRFVDSRVVCDIFRGAPAVDRRRFAADVDAGVDQRIDPRA